MHRLTVLRLITGILVAGLALLVPGMLTTGGNFVLASPEATTIRVAPAGMDISSCGSASSPCQSIQYAVNKASSGDTILVATGTYTYKASADNCSFLVTRAIVCFVDKHLAILGGYSTNNWAVPNPSANPTYIDGGYSRRGVAIIAYNSTASLRMEGFTIQNGLAQGASSGDDFQTFAFGGGIWAQNSAVFLQDVTFRGNRSVGGSTSSQYGGAGSGGGLAIQSTKNNVTSTLASVTFENNQAIGGTGNRRGGLAVGGGLYTYESKIEATGLTFTGNLAQAGSSNGSGIDTVIGLRADAMGGAASFQIGSDATLTQVRASGNLAVGGDAGTSSGSQAGGAYGGAIHAEKSEFIVEDAILSGNTARGGRSATGGFAFGGALMTDASSPYLNRFKVISNAAISGASLNGGTAGAPGGGGMYLTDFHGTGNTAQVVNSIFSDNRAEVGSPGATQGGGGGGFVVQAMTANIMHATFVNNRLAGDLNAGQAILVNGLYGPSGTPASANITNSIITNHTYPNVSNTSAVTVVSGSSASFNRGIFSGNANDTNSNGRPYPPGSISGLSTMFSVPNVGFVAPFAPDWDFHLINTSPAIDQGVNVGVAEDIDGQSRPINHVSDIGADEYTPQTSLLYFYLPLTRR